MHKTYMGVRLKTLREQRGLTQAALAHALKLSPSYLNQIENNQRPLTVPVLLRLQSSLGIDLQFFSEDEEARLISEVREVVAEAGGQEPVSMAEVQAMVGQLPVMAQVLVRLHKRCRTAEERLMLLADGIDGDHNPQRSAAPLQPYEEVRDFFYERHNHMAVLDERAEQLFERLHRDAKADPAAAGGELVALLERHLSEVHGVATINARRVGDSADVVRAFNASNRTLSLSADIEPGQRAFQLATQIARLDAADLIESFANHESFASDEARALARIGFASYFAGALLLPYRRFLAEAEALRYDIELLSQQFRVSFETVCHRLSTMQRPDAKGIPFFFVRVDRAGNISKRQSATDFHFSRTGGTCPLWNVYEAFAQPGKILTQLAQMPDGRTYLWIARCISRRRGGFAAPARTFAVALGCDVRHAHRLVYATGLDLNDPAAATPIGAGCKVCDRENCAQRAFPAIGRELQVNENMRQFAPYANAWQIVRNVQGA
ncbi:Cro/Cl family transcriptional regulator [Variovorax sp. WS11]|uniref:short-chain fatty acyl-CoA regulator family protein n=1 Tax=Variovorax sp. WS11 TaxID=1105204 RepID=UPI000D0D4401|nr:short-chain fatty acyl-CoA regulator family protein [Variovorax sp. WS11]PSL82194.1 Cro/Cl family transcriptional regulator [Variovorax sp. WS11]